MKNTGKILSYNDLNHWRTHIFPKGKTLVVTNGCFDLLHLGHIRYLQAARSLGDFLLVGLNGDESVKALKGPTRPLNPEADRAEVLAALACVDAVTIFPETRATHFLEKSRPTLYVKGGDYSVATLDADEVNAVQIGGGRIEILPLVAGKSTTNLVTRMQTL